MTNAFNWQGKPSIFTTGKRQQNFGEEHTRKSLANSLRSKTAPVSLPGGSPYKEPDLMLARNPRRSYDALIKGGELGRRKQT